MASAQDGCTCIIAHSCGFGSRCITYCLCILVASAHDAYVQHRLWLRLKHRLWLRLKHTHAGPRTSEEGWQQPGGTGTFFADPTEDHANNFYGESFFMRDTSTDCSEDHSEDYV